MTPQIIQEFQAAGRKEGLDIPDDIKIGSLNRFSDDGGRNKDGWAILHVNPDGTAGGAFGNWKGIQGKWFYTPNGQRMTKKEKAVLSEQIQKAKEKDEKNREERYKKAAIEAQRIWNASGEANPTHAYLIRKRIKPHGLKQDGKKLLVPIHDEYGELQSLQEIFPDGFKKFHTDGKVSGGMYAIGVINQFHAIHLCEGYATGATIYQATGKPVIVAFNSGNLKKVAQIVSKTYPSKNIIIAADNDLKEEKKSGKNPGREAGEEAARITGGKLCLCPVDSDFNDLMFNRGLNSVRQALKKYETLYEAGEAAPVKATSREKHPPQLISHIPEAGNSERHPEKPVKTESEPNQKSEAEAEDWPEPKEIEQPLLPVELLPDDAIPEPIRPWLKDIAHRWSAPIDFAFVSAIISIGSVIGTACGIRPKQRDDWLVVPNLWGAIIGPPSRLKTPILNEIINKGIGRLEKQAAEDFEKSQHEYEVDIIKSETKADVIKKKLEAATKTSLTGKTDKIKQEAEKEADAIGKKLLEVKEKSQQKPVHRRYKVNDCSIEKLNELLKDNPRGLLYYRDELIGLFKRMDKAGNETDRAYMLETSEGVGSYTDDRIGRGTTRAENPCTSIIGSIQPDRISWYLKKAISGGENDGFVQRLRLMVYPDSTPWSYVDQYPDTEAKNAFYKILERLAHMNFVESEAVDDEIPFFRFDDKAQVIFIEWLSELELNKLGNKEEEPIIVEHLGKYRSLAPSLALIYHLVEIADGKKPAPINERCLLQAIVTCEYLETHARRIYGLVINSKEADASKLADKIIDGKVNSPFTARDIYKADWQGLKEKEVVQIAIEHLINNDWLREDSLETGGRPSIRYHINPKVKLLKRTK